MIAAVMMSAALTGVTVPEEWRTLVDGAEMRAECVNLGEEYCMYRAREEIGRLRNIWNGAAAPARVEMLHAIDSWTKDGATNWPLAAQTYLGPKVPYVCDEECQAKIPPQVRLNTSCATYVSRRGSMAWTSCKTE